MTWATLDGQRIVSGTITIPWWGAIVADVVLADSVPLTNPAILSLADGSLDIVCSIVRVADFAGSRSARIVGGGGGWRGTLAARAYDAGVTTAMVLNDAAIALGEVVVVATPTPLPAYARASQIGATLLREVAGAEWYIDTAGVTQIGVPRDTSPITSPFTVEEYSGARGQLCIATESPADWMPGRTFVTPTITTPLTVSMVRHALDNDGRARMEVLTTAATVAPSENTDRLTAALRQLIENTFPWLPYSYPSEFSVQGVDATRGVVELLPTSSTPVSAVPPLAFPLTAYTTAGKSPTVGDTCLVAFVNADPSRPVLVPRVGDVVLAGRIATTGAATSIGITYEPAGGGTPTVIGLLTVGGGATIANTPGSAPVIGAIGVGDG